jgi:cytochrome c-type biogenesis protein CcmH/NrfG
MEKKRFSYGPVYLELEHCDNATAEFQEVLRLTPDNLDAQVGVAKCEGQ